MYVAKTKALISCETAQLIGDFFSFHFRMKGKSNNYIVWLV